jgi:hypothetical protein
VPAFRRFRENRIIRADDPPNGRRDRLTWCKKIATAQPLAENSGKMGVTGGEKPPVTPIFPGFFRDELSGFKKSLKVQPEVKKRLFYALL